MFHVVGGSRSVRVILTIDLMLLNPYFHGTTSLIGAREIALMQDGAVLVNTSRGEVVDETAIVAALEVGKLGAYGADVLTGEPPAATHPLVNYARAHDNVLLTPHIGGFSPDALRVVLALMCTRIREQFAAATV